MEYASLRRRLLALAYEALLLIAVLLAGGALLVPLTTQLDPSLARPALQISLVAVCGLYFVWQWVRGGQTLAMKTWRIRLVTVEGAALCPGRAILRFALATAGTALLGATFFWATFDRDRQFLHDRLAGTRIATAISG